MRYTQYNKELERYVVPCLFKPDGSEISFSIITGETYTAENGAGMRYPIGKAPDLVYGEVIDRLAVLENNSEKLAEVLLEREDTMQLLAKEKQEYYDLINLQKAEIEQWKEEANKYQNLWCETVMDVKTAQAEAIKEFAEKVKDIVDEPALIRGRVIDVIIKKIDNLVKKMTGGGQ